MQPILKEINPEYSSEGLMLKLKLQAFGHLMQRVVSLERILMLGKTEGRRRRGRQGMRWSDGITDSVEWFERTLGDSEGQGSLAYCRVTTQWLHNNNVSKRNWRFWWQTTECSQWRDCQWIPLEALQWLISRVNLGVVTVASLTSSPDAAVKVFFSCDQYLNQ